MELQFLMITLTSILINQHNESMVLDIEENSYKGFDGTELFYQTWTKHEPSALILGVHGMGEHSESYTQLAEGLAASAFQLTMPDLRGHGRSGGKCGVGSIDEFVLDVKLLCERLRKENPNLPLFILGHSMGGLVVTKFLIRNAEWANSGDFNGAILSSPLMGIAFEVPFAKRKSAKLLSLIAPNFTLSNEIHYAVLSHDSKIVQGYEADNLRHDRVSPRLFLSILSSIDYVFENAAKIQLPIFVQQAGDDRIVSQPKGFEFFQKLTGKDKDLRLYRDMFHEIYNEIDRVKVFEDLVKWLNQHLLVKRVRNVT